MRGLAAIGIVGVLGLVQPAHAIELTLGSGASGELKPEANMGACGTLTFPPGETFVGELSATGYVDGPGTQLGTVRGVLPIQATGYWHDCIPGSYFGATVGEGKFTLTGHSSGRDYTSVKQCVVNNGTLTCV